MKNRSVIIGFLACFFIYAVLVLFTFPAISYAQTQQEEWDKASAVALEGWDRFNASDYHSAIEKWEEALPIFQRSGNQKLFGILLSMTGLAYQNITNYRKAIEYYKRALPITEETENKVSKGSCLSGLGISYSNLGDYRKAIGYYEKAIDTYEEIGDKKSKAAYLVNLGETYSRLNDHQKVIECYEQAIAIYDEIGDKKSKGSWLGNLGDRYNAVGNYQKAIKCYEQALTIAEVTGDKSGKGLSLGRLGTAYHSIGNYQKAIEYYEKALANAEETGDKVSKGAWLGSLGGIYLNMGDNRKAIDYIEHALTIAEETGNKAGKGAWFGSLGVVYHNIGDYRKAIENYEKALVIAEETGDKKSEVTWLGNMGPTYAYLDDYRKAINYGEKAIAIAKEIGIPYDAFEGYLGGYYLVLGQDEKAFSIFTKYDHPLLLGVYYLKNKKTDYQKAREQFNRGREEDEKTRNAYNIVAKSIGLGLANEGLTNYEEGYRQFKKAIDYIEDQRGALTPSEKEHYLEGKVWGFPRVEAYKGAARCAFMMGRTAEAFYWAENTKGRTLSEILSRRYSGDSLKIYTELAREEGNLIALLMINKKQQQTAFEKNNLELLRQLEGEYPDIKQRMDSLIDRLRKEYPQYAAIRYPQPVKLSQLSLKNGEVIIEYEVTEPFTIALVIRNGIIIHSFKVNKTRAEIEAMVQRFRSPFQAGYDAKDYSLNLAKELADILIKPAIAKLKKGEHLIIIPDGPLSLLPFESLLLSVPAEELKAEARTLALLKQQGGEGMMDKNAIVRGLTRVPVTKSDKTSASQRVSTHILFDTGADIIRSESLKQLDAVVAALNSKELKDTTIRIEGHTDSVGNPMYNLKLSLKRAKAVKQYLIKNGVSENRLISTGKGDTEPIGDNVSEVGRKKNRRVDFVRVANQADNQTQLSSVQGLVYVMDEYTLSYYQSASVLSLLRDLNVTRVKEPTFFGLGDPVFDSQDRRSASLRSVTIVPKKGDVFPDIVNKEETKESGYTFSRLENTAKEVNEVSRLFSDSKVLIGADASKKNVMKEDLTSRRYVLFSTHGILGNEIPYIKQPALVLNLIGNEQEDGFLTATEILNMNMNADLVGLSACNTGLGIQSAGEGVVGLSRAFMYAGTDSVLVSLWSVADESTYKLMVKFFEGLKTGKDKHTALRDAKMYLRQNGYGNPFYWAPFILIGEAN